MKDKIYQITVEDILIEVFRKNIKNLYLTVKPPDGQVRITAPLKVDDERIRLFAISKQDWIKKQQAKLDVQHYQSHKEFISGESHCFKGKIYLLNVIESQSFSKVVIRENYLDLYIRRGSEPRQREKILTDWYRQQLKQEIPPLLDYWQKMIGVTVNEWGVKKMKTKWGTCNIQAKRIWLNLELIQKPQHCLEYVLVHELVHLLECHHNQKFYAYMSRFLPHWKTAKEELKQKLI